MTAKLKICAMCQTVMEMTRLARSDAKFNELLDAAAAHFQSPNIQRRTTPLTTAELNQIMADDDCLFLTR